MTNTGTTKTARARRCYDCGGKFDPCACVTKTWGLSQYDDAPAAGAGIQVGQAIEARGEAWRVLAVDSDQAAAVWCVSESNPDRDAMIERAEIRVA